MSEYLKPFLIGIGIALTIMLVRYGYRELMRMWDDENE